MAKLFKFEVITPTRTLYSDEVESIVFETENGQMGVMAGHVPMLVANKACPLKIRKSKDAKPKYSFISEGFIDIAPDKVTAVVDEAEWVEEIDLEAAIKAKKVMEEDLAKKKQDLGMKAELTASIERSAARIKTARKMRQ